jgi:hypothetical protein
MGLATDLSKGTEEAALALLVCFVVALFVLGLAGALRFGGGLFGPFFPAAAAGFFPFVTTTLPTLSLSPPLLDVAGVSSVEAVVDEPVSRGHGTCSTRSYSGAIRLMDREESPAFILYPYQKASNMLVWRICSKNLDFSYQLLTIIETTK